MESLSGEVARMARLLLWIETGYPRRGKDLLWWAERARECWDGLDMLCRRELLKDEGVVGSRARIWAGAYDLCAIAFIMRGDDK